MPAEEVASPPFSGATSWCLWDFAHLGRGTLAPVDAPRFVVRGSLYRYIRNPMCLSVLTALAGEAFAIPIGAARGLGDHRCCRLPRLCPRLRGADAATRFGTDYDAYRRAVPRWRRRRPHPHQP